MIARKAGRTEKLYETDGHLVSFDATVLSCQLMEQGNGYAVVLDRTAFFPEGGGQYADRGTLGGVTVRDVRILHGELIHETDAPLTVGTSVHGEIDAALRFRRMQNHSGEHILSGLIYAAYGYNNVGFHLSDAEMTMDIDGVLTKEALSEMERRANEVIWRNVPVTAEYPSPQTLQTLSYRSKLDLIEDVRIVTIEGVDACACCAPHVAHTGEIGILRIVDWMNYKGGMRLWVLCGADALESIQYEHETLNAIARSFSTGREETLHAVEKMQRDNGELRAALGESRRSLALARLDAAATNGDKHLLFFDADIDTQTMRYMAEQGAARCLGICGVFCPAADGTARYHCISEHIPLRALSKELHTALGGKGGGSDRMIQGSIPYDESAIRTFFENI